MRISILNLQIIICTILCIVSVSTIAWADNESSLRQQLFEMDKASALANFDKEQKQACIKAFNSRYESQYNLRDNLAFNEPMSLVAYDKLFWKGGGNLQRGLLFTAAVNDKAGAKAGNLICYYAIIDSRLDFQSAYMLPSQNKEAIFAANFSSKE